MPQKRERITFLTLILFLSLQTATDFKKKDVAGIIIYQHPDFKTYFMKRSGLAWLNNISLSENMEFRDPIKYEIFLLGNFFFFEGEKITWKYWATLFYSVKTYDFSNWKACFKR